MGREVELKLQLSPDGPDAVRALLGSEPQVVRMHAVYFDTPDHALAAARLSLRIRVADGKAVQTIKAAGGDAAGLFARAEWEREVTDMTPVFDASTPIAAMLGDRRHEIVPLFEVRVERQIWRIDDARAAVEIALDIGEVMIGERRSAICEIEFELEKGEPSSLFTHGRRIAAVTPIKLGILSKAERGYRLIESTGAAVKAEPLVLASGTTAAEAFQRVAQACLRHFRLNEDLLEQRRDEAALHQARVALRRLRSAFSLWRAMLDDAQGNAIREELRSLAGALGEARNLDVLIQRLGAGALRDRLMLEREKAYDDVEALLASSRTSGFMLALGEWLVAGPWLSDPATERLRAEPARSFAQTALERFRRKVKRGGRRLERSSDESRHDLRKTAKKLRYAADFLGGLFDGGKQAARQRRFVSRLAKLQDALGALNDLATAGEVLAAYGLGDLPADEKARATRARPKLIAKAAQVHDRFADAKRFWW